MNNEYKSKVWNWLNDCEYFNRSCNTFDFTESGEITLNGDLHVKNKNLTICHSLPFNIAYCKEFILVGEQHQKILHFKNLEKLPTMSKNLEIYNLENLTHFRIAKQHFYHSLLLHSPRDLLSVEKINAEVIDIALSDKIKNIDLLPNTKDLYLRNCDFTSMSDISFRGENLESIIIDDCGLDNFKGFPKVFNELRFSTYKMFHANTINELEKTNIKRCYLSIPNLTGGILSIIEISEKINVYLSVESSLVNRILNSYLSYDKPYEYIMDCAIAFIEHDLGDFL